MTHTFKGRYQLSGIKDEIEVDVIDRESAKAYLRKERPTFKIEEV